MPIAYACPHCGKQFAVSEEYAGQSGPCAGCGKRITVPMATGVVSYVPPPRVAASGAGIGVGCAITAVVCIVLMVVCGGIGAALVIRAMQSAQNAALRSKSANNVKQIALAIHNYHDTYGTFPPAYVADASGKPLYSGRVLLLPFLEQAALFNAFNKDEAWDSPQNRTISDTVVDVFRGPSNDNDPLGQTDYLFVTGAGTVFEAGKRVRFTDILDGTANTLMVVEVKDSGINWAEPRDLDLSQAVALPAGNSTGVNVAATCDGSIRFLHSTMAPEMIRKMATRGGGETLDF